MKLYVDLETFELIEGPGFRNPVTSLRFKRGDAATIEVAFLRDGTTAEAIGDPASLEMRFGVKPRNRYDVGYLVHTADWTMPAPAATSPVYQCSPSFNTEELNSALNLGSATSTELSEITLMGEITWREGIGEPTSTRTFLVIVENDVNRGDEGVPESAVPAYPAPGSLITLQTLGGFAVRHDSAQTLSSGQMTQARANIGAQEVIVDGGLTISKVSGLQTALNGKAASSHTHAIGSIQSLASELSLRVGYRIGLGPSDLDATDQLKTLLLEKNGSVWLHNPNTGAILLTQQASGTLTDFQIVAGVYAEIGSQAVAELTPGQYEIQINVSNFSTSSYGSHALMLTLNPEWQHYFNSPAPGNLAALYDDYAGNIAVINLESPSLEPLTQSGTIQVYVGTTAVLMFSGTLPAEGDYADVSITITPV